MAKKKPTPPDEGPKPRGRSRPVPAPDEGKPESLPPAPEAKESRSRPARAKPKAEPSRLDQARELAAQAAQAHDPRRSIALAKQALAASPDCAEAYYLLADHARTRKEALGLFEQAVAAAGRVLGPEIFVEGEGHFWGLLETRPYMRARLALAEALWSAGRRAEAAEHLAEMLRLNPGDNQGVRYILASWLLSLDRLDDLEGLLDRFDEDSATWVYTRTLASFRRSGDSPASKKHLQAAKKSNKYVPAYLLGRKTLPAEQPPFYSPGDENDAIIYVSGHLAAWKSTPGAIAWLRSKVKDPRQRKSRPPASEGPSPSAHERLRRLPSESDSWQADFRQFARRVEIAGERVRPWMVLVSSRTRDLVLAHALTEQAPSPEALWDIVASAMEQPAAGDPHRPTEIQIRPSTAWDSLTRHFEAIGVACQPSEVLDQVDYLFDDLTRHMAGVDPPGLLDMPGVQPEQVGRFFEAASAFYLRAPWRSLGYEAVIRIECDRYESGPWFAVIMGQSGLTLGLALYEDLSLLRRMWAGKLSDEEGARRTVALTVTFDDESSMPEVDLEAIERHGWPIAAPEAYPSLFRKERGLSMRPPLSWEIDLMDACLRVLPDFVARRAPDDPTRELVPVTGPSGTLELGLSWIQEPI
jgi:tetratricopeptide (TPR) repeat protein